MLRKISTVITLFVFAISVQAQIFTMKTNALMDCMMAPNVELSLTTTGRTAISASVFGTNKPWGKDIKLLGVSPMYKYWLGGRAMDGYYLGIGATYANYDITWSRNIYNGETAGVGLLFGYDVYLSKRVNLEFHAGCGAYYYRNHRYYVNDEYTSRFYNEKGITIMPMNVGITIGYIFN